MTLYCMSCSMRMNIYYNNFNYFNNYYATWIEYQFSAIRNSSWNHKITHFSNPVYKMIQWYRIAYTIMNKNLYAYIALGLWIQLGCSKWAIAYFNAESYIPR